MKKYVLIAASAVLALGACSKVVVPSVSDNEIGFTTYTGRATKASGSFVTGASFDGVTAADQVIGVYAWNTGETAWASFTAAPANFFKSSGTDKGVAVTLADNGATASATYSPVRYWPTEEAKNLLTFFAYYPHNTKGAGIVVTEGNGLPTFGVTVQDTPATQVDFMVAAPVADQKYSTNNGVVPFVFGHKLTQVNVQVKLKTETAGQTGGKYDGATIKVREIKFTGINNAGTYTYAATTSDAEALACWSSVTGSKDYTVYSNTAGVEVTTTAQYADAAALSADKVNANTMLLMPQALAASSQKYSITYEVLYTDGTSTVNTLTGDLTNTTVPTWYPNKNVNYTFEIGLRVIKFTATAGAWVDEASSTITIE